MEQMAYVAVILNGITLVSPEPIPYDKCVFQQKYNTSIIWMCIEKELDCGRGTTIRCKGRVE